MSDTRAKIYLDSCALGYAAAVQASAGIEQWEGARAALHDAGIRLAAVLGNLGAAERAELEALRRFRDGMVGLRGELMADTADGRRLVSPREHAIETIDALLFFAAPDAPA